MSARLVQSAARDVLVADGESIILLMNSRVARLSPIGTACFELLAEPLSLEELAEAVEERFGSPPEASALAAVAAIVDELVAAGLIAEVDPDQHPERFPPD